MIKRIVDVFIRDRLVASYAVVLAVSRPAGDEDYVEQVRQRMAAACYPPEDISGARFVVRSLLDRI